MNYLFGAALVVVGVIAIIFGDKTVQKDGGVVLKTFSKPSRFSVLLLKWAIGLMSIWFGIGFLFGKVQL